MPLPAVLPKCEDHPTKRVSVACARCGNFLCEWCVKTAPSWGAGLCRPCQDVTYAKRPPLSRTENVIAAALLFRSLGCTMQLGAVLDVSKGSGIPEWALFVGASPLLLLAAYATFDFVIRRGRRVAGMALLTFLCLDVLTVAEALYDGRAPSIPAIIFGLATLSAWRMLRTLQRTEASAPEPGSR